jgi:tRNA A-37 threonylcarbamoyl transferase component Bud32
MSWHWTLSPGADVSPLAGREPQWFPPRAPLKDNNARALFTLDHLFLKYFKSRTDQASSEWNALLHLAAAGVPVPRPVAWSPAPGGGAVLATEKIPHARPLIEAFDRRRLPELAALVRRMHAARFLHRDLHLGNVLVTPAGLAVLDLHRGTIGAVSPRDEERAVGQLAYSITRAGTSADALRFLRAYFGKGRLRAADPGYAWTRRVLRHLDAHRRRHLASRTRRCLKASTGFAIAKEGGAFFALRRPFTLDRAREAVKRHDDACAAGRAAKALGARRITEVEGIWVKEWKTSGPFRALRNWIRGSPARAAWIAAQGLRVRGLPAPEALALVETRGRALFAARGAAGKPLDRFAREDGPRLADRRPFLEALAALVRRLHSREAHHRDLKANNILADGPTRFAFLDLEDVEFRRVRRADAVRALAQLNAALPYFTRTDRWRMLKRYSANWPVLGDLRKAARDIWALTLARKHNYPVTGPGHKSAEAGGGQGDGPGPVGRT